MFLLGDATILNELKVFGEELDISPVGGADVLIRLNPRVDVKSQRRVVVYESLTELRRKSFVGLAIENNILVPVDEIAQSDEVDMVALLLCYQTSQRLAILPDRAVRYAEDI